MPANSEDRPAVADVEALVSLVDPEVARVLDHALEGKDVSAEDALTLMNTTGLEYTPMTMAADELRRRTVGDAVTYVVNCYINFTNVCIKRGLATTQAAAATRACTSYPTASWATPRRASAPVVLVESDILASMCGVTPYM